MKNERILGAEEWHQVFRYTLNECFLFKRYWFSCTVHGAAKMRSVPWFCVPHQSNGNLRGGTTRPSGRRLTEMFENWVDEFHGRTQSPSKDTVTLSWGSPRVPLLDWERSAVCEDHTYRNVFKRGTWTTSWWIGKKSDSHCLTHRLALWKNHQETVSCKHPHTAVHSAGLSPYLFKDLSAQLFAL